MAEPQIDPNRFDFEKLFTVPAGEPLPDEAPGDDRAESGLKARSESYRQADDLNWLVEGMEPEAPSPAEEDDGLLGMAKAVALDVGKGAVETPRQIVGGFRDAVQNTLDFADTLQEIMPLGGFQVFSKEGAFDPKLLSASEYKADRAAGKSFELPDVGEASTVTGAGIRSISQFLTGLAGASRVMGGLQAPTAAGTVAKTMAGGAAADFFAFDPNEERLSNLIESNPSLSNPVTEYLAAKPEDSDAEGRLKNAVEGLGLGVASAALFRGLKAYRSMRAVMRDKNAAERVATTMRLVTEEQTLRGAGEMSLVGRAGDDAPLVLKKAQRAEAETELGVPTDVAARSLTERGLTPLGTKSDVFVNFARINAPEDIQRIIKDTASAFKPDIEEAKRGVRTNAQTALSASDVDAWDTLLKRRQGTPLNAEQSVAARELWATAAEKLGQVANVAASTPTPENLFQFRRMLATFHAVQKEVIAARTETARALQSWAMPVGGNLEKMRDMTEALNRAGGVEESADLARRFAALARLNDGKAAAMGTLAEKTFAQKALGTVQEYWINALLSNPKTHMVNITSNAGIVALSMIERGTAARLGRVFRDDAGGVELGEAVAQLEGIRGGIIDAFRNAGKSLRTGETGYGMNKIEMPRQRYISSGTWNVRSNSWLGRGVDGIGSVVNVPGSMLQAEDEFFKTIGYRMEIHAQATRMATRELREGKIDKSGLKARISEILDNPPESMRMDAVSSAAYQTFTSEPGKFVRGFQRIVGEYPALKFIVPFINTPANILKYTFERTPLAPVTAKYRAAIAKGGAEADLAQTKMAMGTMALLYAIDLGMQGYTSGSGPADSIAEMQNWRRQGNQPYSIKIGDKQIAFNRLDPLGYHLGIGADLAEYMLNADPDEETTAEFQEGMAAAVFSVAENMTSKSYMQGLALLLEAVNDPKQFAPAYLERFGSSFIPAGVAEVARLNDPIMRDAHEIVTAMKRRLPGYSSELPPRRDLWGRPLSYQSGLGQAYDTLSPFYGTTSKPEPIDQLMEKDGWFVGMGGSSFTIEGERVSLKNRPEIKSRFYELRGATKPSLIESDKLIDKYGDNTLLETLNAVVTGQSDYSEAFSELETADDREDFVKDIVRDYYNAAKDRLFTEYPELLDMAERKRTARQPQ